MKELDWDQFSHSRVLLCDAGTGGGACVYAAVVETVDLLLLDSSKQHPGGGGGGAVVTMVSQCCGFLIKTLLHTSNHSRGLWAVCVYS